MWIKGSFPEDVMLKYSSMPNYGVEESSESYAFAIIRSASVFNSHS